MIDAHVHLERGPYTLEWVDRFVQTAVSRGIQELCLLEHCYMFPEFLPMYDGILGQSAYMDQWFARTNGHRDLQEYLGLVEQARGTQWPIQLRFGLEVCYFPEHEGMIRRLTEKLGLDFLVGSVHYVDGFAFDHRAEHWAGRDVDALYRRYFALSVQLAQSRLFDGIAHPDCIKLFGHAPSFSRSPWYEALAQAVAENGLYAEQSTGIARRTGAPIGMAPDLLTAMQRRGVRLLTASDAHAPEDVGLWIPQAQALLGS